MTTFPRGAHAVVIGAGIVGNSLAYHLARLGWTDLVLLDKGPLPNPGGSTGHASNFIYPVDHSKEMTALTLESVRQYTELGVFTECGGIEVARTEERLQELTRRVASAKSWGVEPVSLVTPAEVKELVPYIDETVILGGFYSPTVGVVDSLRGGTIMRERAQELGALTVWASTEVLGIDVEGGSVRRVRTSRGDIEAGIVVICCGVWSPRLARMAGASIPLTPAIHQMIDVGPVPRFASAKGDIEFPIVRDMDTNMYERQHGGGLEIGSYAHRPILHDPDEIPSVEEAALSPTEFPFTQADFNLQLEHALELMPEIVGDESVGVKYAINGILSLTPDGLPVLGETPEVKGLWSAAAVWIKEGPGVGKSVAEWMVHGESGIDLQASDVARFYEHQKTAAHVSAVSRGFNQTDGIVHPAEQWASNRNVRLSPCHERERELGAVFFETAGWERPHWYESNAPLLEEYGDRVGGREAEWESRWWSPIVNAEHLAMRDRAAMFDLTAFFVFDVTGPGALDVVQRVSVRQLDVALGRVVYTPILSQGGGFKSDLTIMRLGNERFRVVTGGAHGMADLKWFADHLPENGSAQVADLTSAWCTIGLWGPRARDILASVTGDDVSHEGFRSRRARRSRWGRCACSPRASRRRRPRLGALRADRAGRTAGTSSGRPDSRTASCLPGSASTGRPGEIEKCYRVWRRARRRVQRGRGRHGVGKVKDEDFVGREATLRHREEEPAAILCTLTVDDHTSSTGIKRYMLGREPILTRDGAPHRPQGPPLLRDERGRGAVGRQAHPVLAYLPPEHARGR